MEMGVSLNVLPIRLPAQAGAGLTFRLNVITDQGYRLTTNNSATACLSETLSGIGFLNRPGYCTLVRKGLPLGTIHKATQKLCPVRTAVCAKAVLEPGNTVVIMDSTLNTRRSLRPPAPGGIPAVESVFRPDGCARSVLLGKVKKVAGEQSDLSFHPGNATSCIVLAFFRLKILLTDELDR